MNLITYKTIESGRVFSVRLDGKDVGFIRLHEQGWQYHAMCYKNAGAFFDTLAECKASLEED